MSPDYDIFALGDMALESGEKLRSATLAYKTYGTLNADASNVVLFPTAYGGTHVDNEWMIGRGRALDPDRWFIVCPNLFGGGLSSSPSNSGSPGARDAFPTITVYDNVAAQERLLTEALGVREIALAVGFSMGAQQVFHWACAHPDRVKRLAPICGSARTAPHNRIFLDSIKAALTADPAWNGGHYDSPPLTGLRTVGAVWAAWGHSQAFHREERWRETGATSSEQFVRENYIDSFAAADANNLLAMLWTWRHADVSSAPTFNGDFAIALAAIQARTVVMPCATDLYFPPEDSAIEVRHMRSAELVPIPSVYGHAAGGGSNAADNAFIEAQIARLLATPVA